MLNNLGQWIKFKVKKGEEEYEKNFFQFVSNYYVIAGYDLTKFRMKNYEDWKWTDEGEQNGCYL